MSLYQLVLFFCLFSLWLQAQGIDTLDIESQKIDIGKVIIEEEVIKEFAPDFEMIMEDGSIKMLSDFRGRVIYLSFWASWCKPCINGFNKYRQLRNDMESEGVLMLNVSINKTPEKWKAAIIKHRPNGIHARVEHGDVRDAYQMYNVPRYEIIGKKGQFLYLSEESGRDILELFREFVKD